LLIITAIFIVLLLPGLALQAWLAREWGPFGNGRSMEILADTIGISISLTALIGLGFNLLGFPPGWLGTLLLYSLCFIGCIARLLLTGLPERSKLNWREITVLFGGLAVLAGITGLRFYQSRALAFPNWVDSAQHSLIVRVMLEYGGLPSTLRPYLDVPFSYHYGFHLITAVFAFMAQLQPDQAVLIFGNLLNAQVSLSIYRLARSSGMDMRAAALSGLLSGFVLQMPAYYLSWGRYTLLTGLILLPLAMAAALDFNRENLPERRRWIGLRLALLTSGVCLTHYLATLLLLFFLAILGFTGIWRALRQKNRRFLPWQLAAYALAGGIAALPWLLRALSDNRASANIELSTQALKPASWDFLIYLLGPKSNHILMILALIGLIFALRRPNLRSLSLWAGILLLMSQPFTPQLGPFRPDLYVIVLFIPAALFLADLLVSGGDALTRVAGVWPGRIGLLACVLLLVIWGIRETRDVVNPVTIIANQADRQALDWVQQNTPPEARFYINATLWQGNIYRGLDGGYWLLPYTGRFGLVPPIPYVWSAAQVRQINAWAKTASALSDCNAEFWKIMLDARLNYVYVRKGAGVLQPDILDRCTGLQQVYSQEGVFIYQITSAQ
jgi:hypothetical protein